MGDPSEAMSHLKMHIEPASQVYLQQNKKKAKTEGKKCHAKTRRSKKKQI
jgi:hypothetical protein